MLIEKGYLDAEVWTGHRPTYYIEVKATTGNLNFPFYASQNQFDTMEDMKLTGGSASDKVYLIARVFNLGHSGMGLKFYLDPVKLRSDGELQFRADKYLVYPG